MIMHLFPISYNYLFNKSNAEGSFMYLSIQILNLGTHHCLDPADKNLWAGYRCGEVIFGYGLTHLWHTELLPLVLSCGSLYWDPDSVITSLINLLCNQS